MPELLSTVVKGVVSFAATNLDDLIVLTIFFSQVNISQVTVSQVTVSQANVSQVNISQVNVSQANGGFRPRHIVIGQYLGFLGIILLSLPGFFGGLFLPESWIGLLGFIPISMGLHQLWDRIWSREQEDNAVQTVSCKLDDLPARSRLTRLFTTLLVPQVYHVAAVTLANGGDNISIYVSLFASSTPMEMLILLSTFLVLIAIWCMVARYFAHHPAVAPLVTRYGQSIIPYVLISLGIFILIENGSYQLFAQLFSW